VLSSLAASRILHLSLLPVCFPSTTLFRSSDTLPCVYTRSTIPDGWESSKSAFVGKEILQQPTTFVFKDPADDFYLMIEPWFAQYIEHRAGSSRLGFPGSKYDAWDAGQDDSTRTHRTRFHGDHQCAVSQLPG